MGASAIEDSVSPAVFEWVMACGWCERSVVNAATVSNDTDANSISEGAVVVMNMRVCFRARSKQNHMHVLRCNR